MNNPDNADQHGINDCYFFKYFETLELALDWLIKNTKLEKNTKL